MSKPINIFKLYKETGSYEETKKKAIDIIQSNPNVRYDLNVSEGVIDENIAKVVAGIIYHFDQLKGRPNIIGKIHIDLTKEEKDLIVKEYVRLCGNDIKTDCKEIFSPSVIDID